MTLTQTTIDERAYTALASGAAVMDRPGFGILQLTDADRVDFVHRMTTNNIAVLKPGQSAVTVLTSPVARMLFVFTVLQREDDLWLLPAGNDGAQLARHLRGQIFFMDKVKVADLSQSHRRLRLMGPAAAELLAQANLPTPDAETFAEADNVIVLNQQALGVPGYEIIAPVEDAATLFARFEAGGAVTVDADTYNVHRIELGRPGAGAELVESYNPLEAGLAWTCADNKGCYTGQEIIARQITYDKVTKTLVTVRSDELLAPGTALTADGRNVGEVTSAAYSPRDGAPIALAVVKRPQNVAGTVLDANGQRVVVKE
ncbi:MAG: glycine cleavage T C-terminal barrel domain-containing protein [Caldilineaceae bacterium]|nr:hypothetical protein [Caldilineaceae bacterium]